MKNLWLCFLAILAIIVLDQVTKIYVANNFFLGETVTVIDGFFNFTYIRNPGSAFGFLADAHASIRRPLLLFIPVVACIWLLVLMWQTREENKLLLVTYSLIFAGAVGNLIDRFMYGYVIDFLDFYIKNSHFPAFNVADSSISIAAALLILDFARHYKVARGDEVEPSKD